MSQLLYNQVVKAVVYSDLSSNRPVIHRECFSPVMYIQLPTEIAEHQDVLIAVVDMADPKKLVDLPQDMFKEITRPWIDIPSDLLNISIGEHTYRLSFLRTDIEGEPVFYLYFTYCIYTEFETKPYIYMKENSND